MLVVSNIKMPLDSSKTPEEAAIARLGIPKNLILSAHILRRSVDARKRDSIQLVYSVGIETDGMDEEKLAERLGSDVALLQSSALDLKPGTQTLSGRPVIAGFGPGGMFAGLLLARMGYRPLILERGGDMDSRVDAVNRFWSTGGLDTENNVQFGEGGAGTFSDGKLTTRIHDGRCSFILEELAAHGAPREILYQAKPHIGTDRLRSVVKTIRREIICLGGEVRFFTRLKDIRLFNGRLGAVETSEGEFHTPALVLAIGHSARDTFPMLLDRQIQMEPKAFSVGARIEHPQTVIDQGLYGRYAGHPSLPKGEYQLSHRVGDQAVYTFCMCPGGLVVPASSQAGMVVTNGMSLYARDGANANSALVVSVDQRDFGPRPLDGVLYQQKLESLAFSAGNGGYRAPAQTVGRFLEGRGGISCPNVNPSYSLGVEPADLSQLLGRRVSDMMRLGLTLFDRRLKGFAAPGAVLTGLETRTSSPVRILRDASCSALGVDGVYPCGEGAGYAGGIMSAAADGIRVAQAIISRYAPLKL